MGVRKVEVLAPSRLHFGLWSFGNAADHQYGGVGVMIDEPATRLTITPAERLTIAGLDAPRTEHFARRVINAALGGREPACRITLHAAPPAHAGLGSGTQLGMSLAAGLAAWHALPTGDAVQLARWAGRGLRSAVGLYGFARGGLIVEEGKPRGQHISRLFAHADLPSEWRFVLLRVRGVRGLSGEQEQAAISSLPPVPGGTTARMVQLTMEHLLPAAEQGQFAEFSEHLYQYGRLAGECFAARQGGVYASPQLEQLVAWLRGIGVAGVGQSSWGPTLYALVESQAAAAALVERIERERRGDKLELSITPASRQGAIVRVERSDA